MRLAKASSVWPDGSCCHGLSTVTWLSHPRETMNPTASVALLMHAMSRSWRHLACESLALPRGRRPAPSAGVACGRLSLSCINQPLTPPWPRHVFPVPYASHGVACCGHSAGAAKGAGSRRTLRCFRNSHHLPQSGSYRVLAKDRGFNQAQRQPRRDAKWRRSDPTVTP
jgi:hypothetical protein